MELNILNFIHQNLSNDVFNCIFIFFTTIVEHGELWICAGAVLLFTKKYRAAGICVLIALALSFSVSELLLKNLVCRPRPFYDNPDITLIIPPPSGYSFPSSHSAVSFASAVVIFYFNKKLGAAAIATASLVAFSRLYLYVHYPSDVLFGICIGILCGAIVIGVYKYCIKVHYSEKKSL